MDSSSYKEFVGDADEWGAAVEITNPEEKLNLQVKDLTNKNRDDVFVFNGWMFSSSPSIAPFDHPVYDIWLVKCY